MMREAALYLVGTPIGNLDDLSPRAIETLGAVDVVYAEDTRRTSGLFRRFGISSPLRSLHEHNEAGRSEEVVGRLRSGQSCALVTDAGAPVVSDPGARLVRAVSEAGLPVLTVPGPSAVTAAVGLSGFSADRFAFLGFPPRKGRNRAEWLAQCAGSPITVVAFEAPARVSALLSDLRALGLGDRSCCVCREITKLHEESRRGTVATLSDYYLSNEVRGEVTLVLEGCPDAGAARPDPESVRALAVSLARDGLSTREIVDRLRSEFGLARNEAYDIAVGAGEEEGPSS
jgi:16S rRNA (cytidine1402-2'-O)-methyltransferase